MTDTHLPERMFIAVNPDMTDEERHALAEKIWDTLQTMKAKHDGVDNPSDD